MTDSVTAQQLWFTRPGDAEIRECQLPWPRGDEVLVKVERSAVSAGTELLVYRGQIPDDMALDASIDGLRDATTYPLRYGYACVGQVIALGETADSSWLGKRVFAFAPHASHVVCSANTLLAIPDNVDNDDALFFANMETAVNLVQDGAPRLGENILVIGQGIVGLLLAKLLAAFALTPLAVVDQSAARRAFARQQNLAVFDLQSDQDHATLRQRLSSQNAFNGADLIFEVTGNPNALNLAIAFTGYASRIVIGSWYGNKTAAVALGAEAHRNRLQILTSQVSTLAPELTGRWTKQRRADLAWAALHQIKPRNLITHRIAFNDAPTLYEQLHSAPDAIVQAVFVYP